MVISNEVLQESARRLLLRASDSSFLRTRLSGIDVWLPAETILTMTHCLRIGETGDILLDIETPQLEWMSARLRPGSHFIDVGAATGAICLPLAIRFGAGVKITAFEPAPPARRLLKAAIKRNRISSIKILPYACSAAPGRETIHVFPQDETGVTPFLPEVSTLAPVTDPRARPLQVKVTTLDVQFTGLLSRLAGPAVVKIDVEGLEAKVLAGATRFLREARPALAIDIHTNPFGDGTTESDVRAILQPLGYRFGRLPLVNVLVCEPAALNH